MKNIVALVDFSELTTQVVEQSSRLAQAFEGKLILLHVVPEQAAVVELGLASPTVMQPPSGEKVEEHLQRLLALRDKLTASGASIAVQQIEGGGVKKVLEQCRTLGADLIVLGTHHHSALYHLFVGSFTSDVLKEATCPVMVVPGKDE